MFDSHVFDASNVSYASAYYAEDCSAGYKFDWFNRFFNRFADLANHSLPSAIAAFLQEIAALIFLNRNVYSLNLTQSIFSCLASRDADACPNPSHYPQAFYIGTNTVLADIIPHSPIQYRYLSFRIFGYEHESATYIAEVCLQLQLEAI
ncbi:hypothetical protein AEP_01671 [Curvibacter sp. AEP1-3]|uniref:hypothetical protein n=1 Tax=Curvibacter sp. AEP1-3 TaxID=1844971 RepID=UPI000B3BE57B|nr:hypothetical protein [Curvibacter sp. AEP1-3]ARV18615.1 hypothetical protein AEP_01671 [Curvibacter sp. AEP1-3]